MKQFTLENVETELDKVKKCPLTLESAKLYVLLSQAKKYMKREERQALTHEEAVEWVKHMTPAARWTMDQTTAVMQQKGYSHNTCEFYAVMNALASDYGKTMAKYGADKPEIWAELANDWLNDADAKDGKATIYFRDIVQH